MTIRISEIIHKWMGWCPAKSMTTARSRMSGYEMNSDHAQDNSEQVKNKRTVDYGSTGTSPLFFIVFLGGITGIVLLLTIIRIVYPYIAGIILCGLFLFAAIITIYQDVKRAALEYRTDALVIYRPPLKPVVIPKDTIATAEVRDNVRPVPLWLLTVFLFVIPVSVTLSAVINSKYSLLISGGITSQSFLLFLGFGISIVLFFLAIYYHSYLRSHYPKMLVITTTKRKMAVIYGKNSEELAEMQEKLV